MAGFPPNCGSKRKERDVKTKRLVSLGVIAAAIVAFLASWPSQLSSQQGTSVSIDKDDIGGVVTSTKGPEAGVWVIAETFDLPTGYRKIAVTDDRGRYVLPDLQKVKATPGKTLNLTAVVAPNARAAAEYYPAQYWYSLVQPPAPSEFPGTGQ